MLKINIFVRLGFNGSSPDDFNIENLIQKIKEDGLQSYVMEGSYPITIKVNGVDVLQNNCCYPFNENLKALNNLFFQIIKSPASGEFKINFMAGLGAPENYLFVTKKLDNLVMSANKGGSFVVDFSEDVDMIQAVEEVIRVVEEYKNICKQVAEIISPKDIDIFLNQIFVEPTWNHDPWFPLEQAWQEYKQKHNITEKGVEKAVEEENNIHKV